MRVAIHPGETNNMKSRLTMLAGAFVLALATTTLAAPSIHERLDHMEARIQRGIKTGDLTRREAEGLRTELREIKKRERRMRDDGRLSERERTKLHADLDRLDRHITREKRDDQQRRR
jgi:septal ring factor EnvC (AmiA/AmiB activator)